MARYGDGSEILGEFGKWLGDWYHSTQEGKCDLPHVPVAGSRLVTLAGLRVDALESAVWLTNEAPYEKFTLDCFKVLERFFNNSERGQWIRQNLPHVEFEVSLTMDMARGNDTIDIRIRSRLDPEMLTFYNLKYGGNVNDSMDLA